MIYQRIVETVEICHRHDVRHVIVSPGSRSAPLVLAFARSKLFEIIVVPDERAAAFIALGVAQATQLPVVVVCTSGSAGLNLSPAIAEAFYQHVPLLVFTADRPPEWIDQRDGQTLRQNHLHQSFVKMEAVFPEEAVEQDQKWHAQRLINEAINTATKQPAGPVHINFPFREPLYPDVVQSDATTGAVKIIAQKQHMPIDLRALSNSILPEITQYRKIVILVGQTGYDSHLHRLLRELSIKNHIPVVGDVLSNLYDVQEAIVHADTFLINKDDAFCRALQPDLLISMGRSIISKNLKLYLRRYQPAAHWHVSEGGEQIDTFQTLTRSYSLSPAVFAEALCQMENMQSDEGFARLWRARELDAAKKTTEILSQSPFGEFRAVQRILQHLPARSCLHLANSMPVRYANFCTVPAGRHVEVWCNRGTSGIDGCTSTAVGAALADDRLHVLITGDMAFFYDRNALWLSKLPANLRIIVLNNFGGGIFRIINKPEQLPELETLFEARHTLTAELTARDYHIDYCACRDGQALENILPEFFIGQGPKLLEVFSESKKNKSIFEYFKSQIIR
jgi:2-succinyl-5-enolpyruvyl-6-hydroxy-3-cyclohexene-1-carboxylate synthase